MPKKKSVEAKSSPGPLQEVPAANEQEEILQGILRSLDDSGISLVEADWRKMTESENNAAIAWAAARRAGVKSAVPLCLIPFIKSAELQAEQDQYIAAQQALRTVIVPVTKFCKPGFEISDEDGSETVQIKVKVPSSGRCGPLTAAEFLSKKLVRVRFARREVGEWGQGEVVTGGGSNRIYDAGEVEIPSYGWSNGDWQFAFWTGKITSDESKRVYKKSGSIELTVIGDIGSDDGGSGGGNQPAATQQPKKKPAAPKKPKNATTPALKMAALPGTTADDLADVCSVSLTDKYSMSIKISAAGDDKFSVEWYGRGPAGDIEQPEPSVRNSINEASKASIGNAIDFWNAYSDDEEAKGVLIDLRDWLGELEKGKAPALIEAEFDDEGDDSEDEEGNC